MRISKIVCDGCGKEITENPIQVFAEIIDRESGDFRDADNGANLYAPDKDFCNGCFERIKNFINDFKATQPKKEEQKEEQKSVKKECVRARATIKELILLGKSKEEVMRETGCTKETYSTTKYKLKSKGLLKENEKHDEEVKTVKCSEVHKTCKYADKKGNLCDYINIVGRMRGCDPEQCTKYERR